MSLSIEEVKKISYLARLSLTPEDLSLYQPQLSNILQFIEQMNEIDTTQIEPLSHPFDIEQRLRNDIVTETNEREKFQKLAPAVESGLYLVPQVIE